MQEHKPVGSGTVIAYLALFGTLIAGMASAMTILIYAGVHDVMGDDAAALESVSDLFNDSVPYIILSIVLTAAVFVWVYVKFGDSIKRNLQE